MGSMSDDLKLPFIDFSEAVEPGTAAWADVRAQVSKAMVEFGCFETRFDQVSLDLRNRTFRVLGELFDLPLERKRKNSGANNLHGYIGQRPEMPLFESVGLEDAFEIEKVEKLACTFWPEGHSDFSKTLQSVSEKLSELDKTVRRMILESFGIEKHLEEHLNSTNYLMRVMKYSRPKTDMNIGLHTHTDKPMVAILFQDEQVEGALQFQTRDGHWIKYKPLVPDSFIVMLGDTAHVWSNGRLHSPMHRVLMIENKERISLGQWSTPKHGIIINAPAELVDDEHPQLFKPFDYTKYTDYVLSEEGMKVAQAGESQAKVFCGV